MERGSETDDNGAGLHYKYAYDTEIETDSETGECGGLHYEYTQT